MNNQNYKKLLKNNKKVKAINIGLEFLDFFLDQTKDLDLTKFDPNSTDIVNIEIFNPKTEKVFFVKTSATFFQRHLQYSYRKFINDHYFSQFSWYNQFYIVIRNLLQLRFLYTSESENEINYVVQMVAESLAFFSKGNNEYCYIDVYLFLIKRFLDIGFNQNDSYDFSIKILEALIESKLFITSYGFFLDKKKFYLSDLYMDLVFYFSSLNIARIGFENETQFDSKIELENLNTVIDNFDLIITNNIYFNQLKHVIFEYNESLSIIGSYSELDFSRDILLETPYYIKDITKAFFWRKILLNEYCLQIVIVSFFKSFSLKNNLKNVIKTHRELILKFK